MDIEKPILRKEVKITHLRLFSPATGIFSTYKFETSGLRLVRRFGPAVGWPKKKRGGSARGNP